MKEEKDETTKIVTFDDPLAGIETLLIGEIEGRADITTLFTSAEGKKLARQIEDQKQFTTAGMLLPLIQILMKHIFPKLPVLFSDEKFLAVMDKSIEETDDLRPDERELMIRFPHLVKFMLKSMEEDADSGFYVPWGERAVERHLGSFVLALHTYVEAFVDATIDRLIENDELRVMILDYCDRKLHRKWINFSELDEVDGGKLEVISELVKRAIPLGLPKRMFSICDALRIRKQVDRFVSKTGNRELLDNFRHFCDMRNQVAHCEPAPKLEEYSLDLKPFDWKEMKNNLKRNLDNAEMKPPEELYEIIDIASEWGQQSSIAEYFSLLETVFKMAVLFSAAFDWFVSSIRKM